MSKDNKETNQANHQRLARAKVRQRNLQLLEDRQCRLGGGGGCPCMTTGKTEAQQRYENNKGWN